MGSASKVLVAGAVLSLVSWAVPALVVAKIGLEGLQKLLLRGRR
jgi:hypothetical protein